MDAHEGAGGAGDFEAFVRASGTQLYRTAYLLCGDHHLAEDLTQGTYAKVFARWRRLSRSDNPVGYARATLVNSFLSHRRLRRNSEAPTQALPEAADGLGSTSSTEEQLAIRRDLLVALRALAPLDRAVLVARFWEDRSVAETAADLGISQAAVRQRSRRALERLRPHVLELNEERKPS